MELTKTEFTETVEVDRYLVMDEGIFGLTVEVRGGRLIFDSEDGSGRMSVDLDVLMVKYVAQLFVQIATDNEPDDEEPPVEP